MVVVAYRVLVSAPVPFGFRSYWDLVGVGTKGLGTGLDNIQKIVPPHTYMYPMLPGLY